MAFNFFETHHLIKAIEAVPSRPTFLKDRFFPTNASTDIFTTEDVLVEIQSGTKKLAPFVAPRKGGVTMHRQGSEMQRYTPPFIAPERAMTIDDLKKRGFGEALYSNLTPEQRQNQLIVKDMADLRDFITRREEAMAAETLLTNGCIMKHIADDEQIFDEKEIRFYEGGSNPATYTPATKWNQAGAHIIDDLDAMVAFLTSRGLSASELICAPDVAKAIINNEEVQKLLDLRRYTIGSVEPVVLGTDSASLVASLNIYGREIKIISYNETYENDEGVLVPYIPAGKCVLTAPGCGRTLYGAVSQVEQADGMVHTYAGARVPKILSDAKSNKRSITLTSCPLLVPNNVNPFISADVID